MNFFKITFDNGKIIHTGFNGSLDEAKIYYLNRQFELKEDERDATVVSVEQLLS